MSPFFFSPSTHQREGELGEVRLEREKVEDEELTARFECSEGAETILCESLLFLVSLQGARPNPGGVA